MKKSGIFLVMICMVFLLNGCQNIDGRENTAVDLPLPDGSSSANTSTSTDNPALADASDPKDEPESSAASESANTLASEDTSEAAEAPYVIAIDPGHQAKGNYDEEPNGPGSDVMKAKVSSGTQGVSTGIPEYELNLAVSLYLRDELEARGYKVIMIRESNDVDISNVERAQIANEAGADAFVRIHADSFTDESVNGVTTLCQTANNPYNGELYEESRRLSELVLEEVVNMTSAKKRRVSETDTMTGINWTTVPTTILEMGFMSNPEEDERMATEEYREKIAVGVANAIDRFLKGEE